MTDYVNDIAICILWYMCAGTVGQVENLKEKMDVAFTVSVRLITSLRIPAAVVIECGSLFRS